MKKSNGKNSTARNSFYLPILNFLNNSTNLTQLRKELSISKQNLNYYLRQLKNKGLIINKSNGLWEVVKDGKNSTQYGNILPKDFIRGHAYIIEVKLPKEIEGWNKRIELLEKSKINYKLVGAMKNIPRIKVMGRKVWLCNNHLRIFDKKDESHYGINAIEGRKQAFWTFYKIVTIINNKLGLNINQIDFEWKKEHYALIKNDLAIDQNNKGIIWRICDETGEWLLIDDSLEKGGELETVGKDALINNVPLQKWWNDNKITGFKVTPSFILEAFNRVAETQVLDKINIQKHQKVLDEMLITLKKIQESLTKE